MIPRRDFIKSTAFLGTALAAPRWGLAENEVAEPDAEDRVKWKAAIIGHTGRGNYGHSLDVALAHRADVSVAAVADANAEGLAKTAARLPGARAFADYHEMLAQTAPRLVVVAPRHSDQHHAMVLAALRAGAHVYCEKPFTVSLTEADEVLAEAEARGLKIAVAHQMRVQPDVVELQKRWAAGEFGELIELRAWGKQDSRAGGEDLMVLGTHLFDLMRLFGGDVEWVTARTRQGGRPVTPQDARVPKDNVGPVAGDEVAAQFSFKGGVLGTFTSHPGLRSSTGRWGLELRGSKGAARLCTDIPTEVFIEESGPWTPEGRLTTWKKPAWATPLPAQPFIDANRRVVDDWLAAIKEKRAPQCSGGNGMHAIEMVMAVYHAALSSQRVALPLTERAHPLMR